MRTTPPRNLTRILIAGFALTFLPTGPASAVPTAPSQKFFLPLDASSGAAFGRGEPRPYALRARVTPSLGFGEAGQVRFGAQLAGIYQNPKWVSGFGASIAVRIWGAPLKEIGVFATLDHLWWQSDRPSSGVALIFDLDGMYRIGLRVDRDWLEQSTIPQATLGVDLPTIAKVLGGRRPDDLDLP